MLNDAADAEQGGPGRLGNSGLDVEILERHELALRNPVRITLTP